jgi:hypothetical protein
MRFVSKANLGVCENCHERPATGEFVYAPQLRGARRWHLCDSCVQQFAPGMPSLGDLRTKAGSVGDAVCGWTSYPTPERPKDDESPP